MTARTNRRATTDRAVVDNRRYAVRVLVDGLGERRVTGFYRRDIDPVGVVTSKVLS